MPDTFYEKVVEAQSRAYTLTHQAEKDRLTRTLAHKPTAPLTHRALFLTGQALVTLGTWIKAN